MDTSHPSFIETIRIKQDILKSTETCIAFDYGCSLMKIIYPKENAQDEGEFAIFECATFTREYFEESLDWLLKQINRLKQTKGNFTVNMMGAKAEGNKERILEKIGVNTRYCAEYTTLPRGMLAILKHCHPEDISYKDVSLEETIAKLQDVEFPALFVVLGSAGLSYIVNSGGTGSTPGGFSWVSGRTLLGLGNLLAGTSDYNELMELASRGDCRELDTCIYHILQDPKTNTYGDFDPNDTVFSFGETVNNTDKKDAKERYSREDLARGVVNLVMSTSMTMIENMMLSGEYKRVYVGGNLIRHELARQLLIQRRNAFHRKVDLVFLKSGLLGALGAMLTKEEDKNCGSGEWDSKPVSS